uniref:Uncharacterized protein n=1 Tax=Arundo donax TaxID=35708 RepID=A0A0A9EDW4_ARUDO
MLTAVEAASTYGRRSCARTSTAGMASSTTASTTACIGAALRRARRRTTPRRASCSARWTGSRLTSPAPATCAGRGSRWPTCASSRR